MARNLQEQFESALEGYVWTLFENTPTAAIEKCLREQPNPVPYIAKLMEWVGAAEAAREWFERHGPAHLQPLPFCVEENLLCSGDCDRHVLMHYGISLRYSKFNYLEHPLFFDYARGVAAMPDEFVKYSGLGADELLAEYPPKPLPGLGRDLRWRPV
jgi:hypothetical protein